MSNTNTGQNFPISGDDNHKDSASETEYQAYPQPSSDGIESVVGKIIDHIEDTDRRSSDALQEIRDRLDTFSQQADAAKASDENVNAEAIERIEKQVANLSQSVESAEQARPDDHLRHELEERLAFLSNQLSEYVESENQSKNAASGEEAKADITYTVTDGETDTLISACLDETDLVEPSSQDQATLSKKEDYQNLYGSDDETVSALAQAFKRQFEESETSPIPTTPRDQGNTQATKPTLTVKPVGTESSRQANTPKIRVTPVSNKPRRPVEAPLQARFAEIAANLEKTLSQREPSETVPDEIGAKFDDLFAKFENALKSHGSQDALNSIENQIAGISDYVEQTKTHFVRIEAVEKQLVQLMDKMEQSQGTFADLANKVADETASRIVTQLNHDKSDDRLDAVQHSVEELISDYKSNETRTSDTFESIHKTLNQMIEHMDVIQNKITNVASQAPAQSLSAPMQVSPKNIPNSGRPSGSNTPLQSEMKVRPEDADGRAHLQRPAFDNQSDDIPSRHSAGQALVPTSNTAKKTELAESTASQPALSEPEPEQRNRRQLSKENFIEAARRAAAAASSQSEEDDAEAPDELGELSIEDEDVDVDSDLNEGVPPLWQTTVRPAAILFAAVGLTVGVGILFNAYLGLENSQIANPFAKKKSLQAQSSSLKKPKVAPTGLNTGDPKKRTGKETKPLRLRKRDDVVDVFKSNKPVQPSAKYEKSYLKTPQSTLTRPKTNIVEVVPGLSLGQTSDNVIQRNMTRSARAQRIEALTKTYGSSEKKQFTTTMVHPIAVSPYSGPQKSVDQAVRPGPRIPLPPAAIGPFSLRSAAAAGNPSAQYEVAARFAQGKGIKRDYEAAARWFRRAASHSFAPAQYRLATLYERGRGLKKDLGLAQAWYQRAAQIGNVKAMHNLAVLHASGSRGTPDYSSAAYWFQKAATQGLGDSQFNLAILYEHGLGVRKNLIESYRWFALAAAKGDKEGAKRRDKMREHLSQQAILSVDRDIQAWRPLAVKKSANQVSMPKGGWNEATLPKVTRQAASENSLIATAQRLLAKLGYDIGPADGALGPRTRKAIETFEKRSGLMVTGKVTKDLVARLSSLTN